MQGMKCQGSEGSTPTWWDNTKINTKPAIPTQPPLLYNPFAILHLQMSYYIATHTQLVCYAPSIVLPKYIEDGEE